MGKLLTVNGNEFPSFYSLSGTELDEQSKSKIPHAQSLDQALKTSSSDPEPQNISQSIHSVDPLLYIYTSGTTGLPKAVIIKHIRLVHMINEYNPDSKMLGKKSQIVHQVIINRFALKLTDYISDNCLHALRAFTPLGYVQMMWFIVTYLYIILPVVRSLLRRHFFSGQKL